MSTTYTVVGDCDGCMCNDCEMCLWAFGGIANYDPFFFCGDPIWGLELLDSSGVQPCDSTTGYVDISIGGTWYSLSNSILPAPPLFPGSVYFRFQGVLIWTFDPGMGAVVDFFATIPVNTGFHAAGGAAIYSSAWSSTARFSESGVELATVDNPYHTGPDPSKWVQTDLAQDPTAPHPYYHAVLPYSGPDPVLGSDLVNIGGWDISASLVNVFFSSNYVFDVGTSTWVLDPATPISDIYQQSLSSGSPNKFLLRLNTFTA